MAHFGYSSWLRLFVARLQGDQAAIDIDLRQAGDSHISPADWMALFMNEFMGSTHTSRTTDDRDESASRWSAEDGAADALIEQEEVQSARRTEASHPAAPLRVEAEKEQLRYRSQGES